MNLGSSFINTIQISKRRLLIASMIAASVVIHTPPQRLHYWNIHLPEIDLLRAIIFFLSISFLFFLIAKPTVLFFRDTVLELSVGTIALDSLKLFALTSLLVVPSTLGIMGAGYAYMSNSPFSFVDSSDQLYQRLLMPALAFVLHLRGAVVYHIFSLMIALICIFLLQIYFLKKKVHLSALEYVSIATSSFIITQFQSPGYTEALSYVLLIILLLVEMNVHERAALFALSLFAHEATILILLAVSIVMFSKREIQWIIVIGVVYGLLWLASFGFDAGKLLSVRTVGSYSTMEWIIKYPQREILGILFSMKALWFLMFAVFYSLKSERMNIVLLIIPGIVLSFLAVDTSRMVGFSFVALIYSIVIIKQHGILSEQQFKGVCVVNVCIPAVYVGVNSGVVFFDGIYQFLQYGVFIK